jgi:hypothetical protein
MAQATHVNILRLAAEKDWRASAHFLERTDPDNWGQKKTIVHKGQVTRTHEGRLELTTPQIEDRMLQTARATYEEMRKEFKETLSARKCAEIVAENFKISVPQLLGDEPLNKPKLLPAIDVTSLKE